MDDGENNSNTVVGFSTHCKLIESQQSEKPLGLLARKLDENSITELTTNTGLIWTRPPPFDVLNDVPNKDYTCRYSENGKKM